MHLETEYVQNKFYVGNFKITVSAHTLFYMLHYFMITGLNLGGLLNNDNFQYVPLLQGL